MSAIVMIRRQSPVVLLLTALLGIQAAQVMADAPQYDAPHVDADRITSPPEPGSSSDTPPDEPPPGQIVQGNQIPWPDLPGLFPSYSSDFSPAPPLTEMIAAMQNCAPPHVYGMLSGALYQTIYEQTGGTGCYAALHSVGRLLDLRILEAQEYEAGVFFTAQGMHEGAIVNYNIGFDRSDGKIIYWTFQYDTEAQPQQSVGQTPPNANTGGNRQVGGGEGCDLYPALCE